MVSANLFKVIFAQAEDGGAACRCTLRMITCRTCPDNDFEILKRSYVTVVSARDCGTSRCFCHTHKAQKPPASLNKPTTRRFLVTAGQVHLHSQGTMPF